MGRLVKRAGGKMKSIILSVKPEWVKKIASGEKIIEIRKTMPKCKLPCKVYIYMTRDGVPSEITTKDGQKVDPRTLYPTMANGRVVAEFILKEVDHYDSEFCKDNECYQAIWYLEENESAEYEEEMYYRYTVTTNEEDNPSDCELCRKSCLSFDKIRKYVGFDDTEFYGWHIDDLKVYDQPKDMSEFRKPCIDKFGYCPSCKHGREYISEENAEDLRETGCCDTEWQCFNWLKKAPQSWCYCEVAK